ncbi:hypothetical protein [Nocardia sp. NPDC058705]|uniref:hypothetical protein n=1 Tax=Nocardia sp. NPDC058705 TaxID=3346609 RepID=UPI0036822EDC
MPRTSDSTPGDRAPQENWSTVRVDRVRTPRIQKATMSTIPVHLPLPTEIRRRWTALALIQHAIGLGDDMISMHRTPFSTVWTFDDDGGGNWAQLTCLDDGRAAICGNDHESSERQFLPQWPEAEVPVQVAGVPEWWIDSLSEISSRARPVGFVYGFDDSGWRRASYAHDDGAEYLLESATSDAVTIREAVEALDLAFQDVIDDLAEEAIDDEDWAEPEYTPELGALTALVAAGAAATVDMVRAACSPVPCAEDSVVEALEGFGGTEVLR